MPYLPKEKIAEIRKELKKTFPFIKFSVKQKPKSSGVDIVIKSSKKINFGDMLVGEFYPKKSINHYYIMPRYFNSFPKQALILEQIKEIVARIGGLKTEYEDVDYGSVPTFYLAISIGSLKEPYIFEDGYPLKVEQLIPLENIPVGEKVSEDEIRLNNPNAMRVNFLNDLNAFLTANGIKFGDLQISFYTDPEHKRLIFKVDNYTHAREKLFEFLNDFHYRLKNPTGNQEYIELDDTYLVAEYNLKQEKKKIEEDINYFYLTKAFGFLRKGEMIDLEVKKLINDVFWDNQKLRDDLIEKVESYQKNKLENSNGISLSL